MKKNIRAHLWIYLPALFAAMVFLGLYLYIHHQKMMYSTKPILFGVMGFFATFALFSFWMHALQSLRRPWLRAMLFIVLLSVQIGLAFYYILEGGYLDYSLIRNYFVDLIRSPNALRLIFDTGGIYLWVFLAGATTAIVLIRRWNLFSEELDRRQTMVGVLLFGLSSYAFFLNAKDNPNPLYQLAWSAKIYNEDLQSEVFPKQTIEGYPYLRDFKPSHVWPKGKRRPHVFIVMVESVGERFVDRVTDSGKPIMPNWSKLSRTERSYAQFYTPSIFTERAHTSILCSILPSYRKKVMRYYADNSLRCLPRVMNDFGYKTLGFKADENDSFDNEIPFLKKIGFSEAYAMRPEYLNDEEKSNVWGWGLQDDYFYRHIFKDLDRRVRENPKQPVFTFLATISSHVPFNKMPDALKALYPDPKSLSEYYETSLHIADRFLPVFFEELDRRPEFRDSLVFIMGDHGIRVGWRDDRTGATTYQNDFFHIPLLVRWKGQLRPVRVENDAHSLMDIAPTIMDWLGMEGPVQFLGTAMRKDGSPRKQQQIIPIIQPYDGMFVSAIQFPWKYVYSLSDGREFLHNLATDPLESVNRIGDAEIDLKPLRTSLQGIFLNQELLQANRIYPPEQAGGQVVGSK